MPSNYRRYIVCVSVYVEYAVSVDKHTYLQGVDAENFHKTKTPAPICGGFECRNSLFTPPVYSTRCEYARCPI